MGQMQAEIQAEEAVRVIHLITEPTRFRILIQLLRHHYCVKALAKSLGISEPAVSQHMRVLKKARVVYGVKIGYQMHYQVDRARIRSLFGDVLAQFTCCVTEGEEAGTKDCSCAFIEECKKRDAKILKEQGYGE